MAQNKKNILRFEETGIKDISLVGGKNASLGEMYANLRSKKEIGKTTGQIRCFEK